MRSPRPVPGGGGGEADPVVLGGGSAAFAAAIKAAEMGRRAVLIEAGTIGGTCVNVGCVPSKALLAAAETWHRAGAHPFRGIETRAQAVDFDRVVAEKDALVAELRQAKYLDVLAAYPSVSLVKGRGVLEAVDPPTVSVGDLRIRGERLVLATGARPWVPEIPGLASTPYWTSEEALSPPKRPERLVVLGGSALGLELAQLYARLGTDVTVLEMLPRIAPQEDEDVSRELLEYLRAEGMAFKTGVEVEAVRYDGAFVVAGRDPGGAWSVAADALLVATGRRPTTSGMGLEEAGVALDARGGVVVDPFLATTAPHVYAAGDVLGQAMFVYVAAYTGTLAAENAFGGRRRADLSALPRVTFTDPQVASVGHTEAAARAQGFDVETAFLPLAYVPRALANRDRRGFVKLVAEKGSGRVLGAHIVAPGAGEMIQPAVFAVKYEMTVEDLRDNFFPYLTMVEGLKLAALTFDKDVSKLSCCAG